MKVREINNLESLRELAPVWSELLERTPGATFCHSLAALRAYWSHFGANHRLRVLLVEENGQAAGILPLAVCRRKRSEPVRVLTFPLGGWPNYYGPIGPDPLATLLAGLDHVRSSPRDWQFIELGWIDDLDDKGRTKDALDRTGFSPGGTSEDVSAIVDLAEHASWDAYCASHNSKWRNDLRRQEKKLAGRGTVTFVRHRTEGVVLDPRWDLYDACEAISRSSWQHDSPSGTMLSKDANRQFFRECHQAAAENGAVDMYLLYVDGRPVAFGYGYHFRGHVTQLKTAYDPSFAADGAGRVLHARVLADSFARGDRIFELGADFLDWKQYWLTRLRPLRSYVHFPSGVVGAQLVRGKRAIERRLRATFRPRQPAPQQPAAALEPLKLVS